MANERRKIHLLGNVVLKRRIKYDEITDITCVKKRTFTHRNLIRASEKNSVLLKKLLRIFTCSLSESILFSNRKFLEIVPLLKTYDMENDDIHLRRLQRILHFEV